MSAVVPATTATIGNSTKPQLRILPASARTEAFFLWRKLEIELASNRLTCSSLWTEIWLNHYGQMIPHQFAVGMHDGKVCGIALVTDGVGQKAGLLALNTRHLGTAGEPDSDSVCVEYNTLLARPEDRFKFAVELWRWVTEETNCDEFRIDGFDTPSIEPLLTLYPQVQVERKPSYYFDLRSV